MFILISLVLGIGAGILDLAIFNGEKEIFSDVLFIGLFLPGLTALVRRMHDVNASGWLVLIPLLNIILACVPGTSGPNRFGDDPKSSTIPA